MPTSRTTPPRLRMLLRPWGSPPTSIPWTVLEGLTPPLTCAYGGLSSKNVASQRGSDNAGRSDVLLASSVLAGERSSRFRHRAGPPLDLATAIASSAQVGPRLMRSPKDIMPAIEGQPVRDSGGIQCGRYQNAFAGEEPPRLSLIHNENPRTRLSVELGFSWRAIPVLAPCAGV